MSEVVVVYEQLFGLVRHCAPARAASPDDRTIEGRRRPGSGISILSLVVVLLAGLVGPLADARANGATVSVAASTDAVGQYGGSVSQTEVVLHKSVIIRVHKPFATVMVGSDKVADVVAITDQTLYVVGKEIGSTRLVILDADKQVLRIVEVAVNADMEMLRQRLAENLPSEQIEVSAINEGILLSGTVRDASELEKAMAIAEQFAPKKVTNGLKVAASQQVLLEVRFVEATRTAARELGVGTRTRGKNFNVDTGGQAFVVDPGPIVTSALNSGAAPFGTMIARLLDSGTDVDLIIRALEEKSLARRLAEPNLTALSGDTASFLAGGEFPIPIGAEDNRIVIEFKQFGVSLAFTPTVLGNGLINLRIVPEVSEIDQATTVQVAGVTVPGLVVRRADTTVELNDGQSFAIAGLLQHTHRKTQEQIPWLGNVPVLGALFRSAEYQKQETDLVIIVTPRLIRAKAPGERLATPLDETVPGNDVDLFLRGRQELAARETASRGGRPTAGQPFGHIIRLGKEISYAAAK
ncbi:MAG: BON domain-containing protein [Rhizobiales bacterium]|nr:BON domain-containing protein [Hyphomicrobiales bacterium]